MSEELKVIIKAEIGNLKQAMDQAKKSVKDYAEKAKKSVDEVNKEFKKYGDAAGKALKAAGTAAVGAATALLGTVAATKEYREEQGKLATAFKTAGASAEDAKTTYNDLYRVLGDSGQAVEAANHLAKLTTNQQELSEWTNICQGVYATFGDSLPIEGLTEAANETARTGQITGGLADALNWAGKEGETYGVKLKENIEFTKLSSSELKKLSDAQRAEYEARKAQYDGIEAYNKAVMEAASAEDFFNIALQDCTSEAEREALIRETLNGLYSSAASNYEETNAQVLAQNEANAKLNDSLAAIGEAMAPIMTTLSELGSEILAQLTPYIQDFAEKYLPIIKENLGGLGDKLGTVLTWIADHWSYITTVGAILLSTAVAIKGVSMALGFVSTAMGVVNAVMAASPVTWIVMGIVAAVAALTAAVILCTKHWDEIRAKVSEVWEGIKTATTDAVNKVKNKFEEMKQAVVDKVTAIKDGVVNKFNEIKQSIVDKVTSAKDAVVNKFNDIKTGITEKVNAVKETVSNTFDKVKSAIMKPVEAARDGVKTAIEKIKSFFHFEWSLPKIKLPHFSISGSFSLNPPSIPHFGVDWYARGGVFDKPTLFPYGNGSIGGLGEAGAEAVVPLEKNTQWLDRIAERLQGGTAPIYLQVDGKTFAEISVDSINALTKQRGSLPLRLV